MAFVKDALGGILVAACIRFVIGVKVYLRPLQGTDLNQCYLDWLNDPEVTRYLEPGTFPTTLQDLEEIYRSATNSRSQVLLAIAESKSGRHIGNVKLGPIHWVHRSAKLEVLIADRRHWDQDIGTEAIRLAVEYGFCRLNLRRINLEVCAEYEPAIRCYERVGFRVEGRMREDFFLGGEFKDRVWMALLRSEYRARRAQKARTKQ